MSMLLCLLFLFYFRFLFLFNFILRRKNKKRRGAPGHACRNFVLFFVVFLLGWTNPIEPTVALFINNVGHHRASCGL